MAFCVVMFAAICGEGMLVAAKNLKVDARRVIHMCHHLRYRLNHSIKTPIATASQAV